MTEPVPALEALWRLAAQAAAFTRRARRLANRIRNDRPAGAENTKAGAVTPARKGNQ